MMSRHCPVSCLGFVSWLYTNASLNNIMNWVKQMKSTRMVIGAILVLLITMPYIGAIMPIADTDETSTEVMTSQEDIALQRIVERLKEISIELKYKGINTTNLDEIIQEIEQAVQNQETITARNMIMEAFRLINQIRMQQALDNTTITNVLKNRVTAMIKVMEQNIGESKVLTIQQRTQLMNLLEEVKTLANQGRYREALQLLNEIGKQYRDMCMQAKKESIMNMLMNRIRLEAEAINETLWEISLQNNTIIKLLNATDNQMPNNIMNMIKRMKALELVTGDLNTTRNKITEMFAKIGITDKSMAKEIILRIIKRPQIMIFTPEIALKYSELIIETIKHNPKATESITLLEDYINKTRELIEEADQGFILIMNGNVEEGRQVLENVKNNAEALKNEVESLDITMVCKPIKRTISISLELLINNIERTLSFLEEITNRNVIIVKGVVLEKTNETTLIVWGNLYTIDIVPGERPVLGNAMLPVPVTWTVYINENTTVKGDTEESSPVIVIGEPIASTEDWRDLSAKTIIGFPLYHIMNDSGINIEG